MEKSNLIAKPDSPLEQDINSNEKSYLFILFLIGIINNTGYVLVNTAAQDISEKFQMQDFMGSFSLGLIVLSGVTRSFNSKYLIKIQHKKRIFTAIVVSIAAFSIIAFSTKASEKWGFYTALVGSVMCGSMQAFGESVMLGYLKVFPAKLIAGWSSGTGFAGPFGTGLLLLLKAANIELYIIFLIMIPVEACYVLCFLWYNRKKQAFYDNQTVQENSNEIGSNNSEEVEVQKNANEQDSASNKTLTWKNITLVMPKMWPLAVNLGLVYYLEYVIQVGWADRAHIKNKDTVFPDTFQGWVDKNAYILLLFCYQIGVFISRSSLYLIKIKRVIIFTILQAMMFGLWVYFAYDKHVNIWIQVACMLFVGLMGGASYVNVNYLLLSSEEITQTEKELAMNICSIFNDTGVLLSSLSTLVISNYIMPNK